MSSILVFAEADGLFGTRGAASAAAGRYANGAVGLLVYPGERVPWVEPLWATP